MASLPAVSGREVVAAFQRAGFLLQRQRGSHLILTKPGHPLTLSVPDHGELKPGTLRALISKSGVDRGGLRDTPRMRRLDS
jgi:predicted RNA binding protein YcfA (HicA-like mRNA interferase family)